MWLRTACLRISIRDFLNMERHVRLAAGCLNSYVHILKAAKWNVGLGCTTQTTRVVSYLHTKRRTERRFCFSKISDVLPVPVFCKCSTQICDQISFCLAGASEQQLFYSVCVCVCVPTRCHLRRWQTDGRTHRDCYPTHLASQTRTGLEVLSWPRGETGNWAINVNESHFISELRN